MATTVGMDVTDDLAIRALRGAAHPLVGEAGDYDPLLELIGEARFVLLGEASHGTHEFYRERAQITKRLIREKGFTAVAVRHTHRHVVHRCLSRVRRPGEQTGHRMNDHAGGPSHQSVGERIPIRVLGPDGILVRMIHRNRSRGT